MSVHVVGKTESTRNYWWDEVVEARHIDTTRGIHTNRSVGGGQDWLHNLWGSVLEENERPLVLKLLRI